MVDDEHQDLIFPEPANSTSAAVSNAAHDISEIENQIIPDKEDQSHDKKKASPSAPVGTTPSSPPRRPMTSSMTNPTQFSYNPFGNYTPSFMHSPMYLNQPYPAGYLSPSLFSYNMGSPRGQPIRPAFTSSLQQNPGAQGSEETIVSQDSTTASSENVDAPLEMTDLNSSPQKEAKSCDQQPSNGLGPQTGYSPFAAASPLRSAPFLPHSSLQVQSSSPGLFPAYSHGYGLAASSSTTDQTKQISLLLSELDAAKAQNKRLAEKLAQCEHDLETSCLKLKTKEVDAKGSTDSSAAAGMVQEVHTAQRKREESMMGRMKLNSQEKEEALRRLRELERRLDEGYSDNTDLSDFDDPEEDEVTEGIDNLLSQIDSNYGVDKKYNSFLRRLELVKQRQREITEEEMNTLLEERDIALSRARKLEEELLKYQKENTTSNNEQHLRAKLAILQQERDLALAQNRQLADEIQTIRIYYSLHKSLTSEPQSTDEVNSLHPFKSSMSNNTEKEKRHLAEQLAEERREKSHLQTELEKMEAQIGENAREHERLNNLVAALRRKLKTELAKAESAVSNDTSYDKRTS
ncbi:mirror-image polydactyly gene 1 protein-like isoform X2 [Saccostrea cucullata]|uniref:mirror-image polydactyly gene 1 protein-like isoform X2 n=1 Tax=Saccostrea cuccullata TaxID=36930 RepID=UPI002ED24192